MGFLSLVDVPDVVCIAMCGAAAAIDLRSYRIPNWLTASGAVLGAAANVLVALAIGPSGAWLEVLRAAALGGVILLIASGALAAGGLMGMGDVKLLAAAGICLRWRMALPLFLYTAIAGGIVALAIAIRRGRMAQVATNLTRGDGMAATTSRHRMPYGLAILAGAVWAVVAKHVPQLAIL